MRKCGVEEQKSMESVRSGGGSRGRRGSDRAIGLGSGSGEAVADYSSEVDALAQG